jgi:hypothetical protein
VFLFISAAWQVSTLVILDSLEWSYGRRAGITRNGIWLLRIWHAELDSQKMVFGFLFSGVFIFRSFMLIYFLGQN